MGTSPNVNDRKGRMKTYYPKVDPNTKRWVIVDLQGVMLGRAATKVASILRGKTRPDYTPHLDAGDFVIAINASGLQVGGKKAVDHYRYHYTGYPGGLRKISTGDEIARKPDQAFMLTVKGMLPKNRLGRKMIKKLHVYAGSEHLHAAQKPEPLDLKVKK